MPKQYYSFTGYIRKMNQLTLFREIIVVYLKIICNRNTVHA